MLSPVTRWRMALCACVFWLWKRGVRWGGWVGVVRGIEGSRGAEGAEPRCKWGGGREVGKCAAWVTDAAVAVASRWCTNRWSNSAELLAGQCWPRQSALAPLDDNHPLPTLQPSIAKCTLYPCRWAFSSPDHIFFLLKKKNQKQPNWITFGQTGKVSRDNVRSCHDVMRQCPDLASSRTNEACLVLSVYVCMWEREPACVWERECAQRGKCALPSAW